MSYTLEQLSRDICNTLKADPSPAGRKEVCQYVSKALLDKEFIAQHVTPDQCKPRKVLYEDPELGVCICGHLYAKEAKGSPHDHGPTWAIYGVAENVTKMTEWKIIKKGSGEEPSLVEPVGTYDMKPGDCHVYEAGDVHSPLITPGTKLIRVEGSNLDHVKRSKIKAA